MFASHINDSRATLTTARVLSHLTRDSQTALRCLSAQANTESVWASDADSLLRGVCERSGVKQLENPITNPRVVDMGGTHNALNDEEMLDILKKFRAILVYARIIFLSHLPVSLSLAARMV